jgi:sugar O-acyltransferase (sialic acid O-acetyltransferase NeuD family)
MTTPLVIIGCGGFGREVFNIVQAVNGNRAQWDVEGFIDDCPTGENVQRVSALGSSHIRNVQALARRGRPFNALVTIGVPAARAAIVGRLASAAVTLPVLLHPDATAGPDVVVGPGSIVSVGSRLSTTIVVGEHVHIDENVAVGQDSRIGDFARLNPQACVSGSVAVSTRSVVGASATILQCVSVGGDAVVGAAACVIRSVPNGPIVKGVPAP